MNFLSTVLFKDNDIVQRFFQTLLRVQLWWDMKNAWRSAMRNMAKWLCSLQLNAAFASAVKFSKFPPIYLYVGYG